MAHPYTCTLYVCIINYEWVWSRVRNTAVDAVRQELLFVGQECGKLLAMRNLVHKVRWAMQAPVIHMYTQQTLCLLRR